MRQCKILYCNTIRYFLRFLNGRKVRNIVPNLPSGEIVDKRITISNNEKKTGFFLSICITKIISLTLVYQNKIKKQ